MSIFDIITIVVFAAAMLICVLKGFLKILLKFGALVIAALLAKIFGSAVGDIWFSDLIKSGSEGMAASVLSKVNEALATVIGTVIVFVIFYVVLRIIFSLVAKLVKKAAGIGALDRVLGAVFGIVAAFGIMFIFAELVRVSAAVITYVSPDSTLFDTIEDTLVFKYFY